MRKFLLITVLRNGHPTSSWLNNDLAQMTGGDKEAFIRGFLKKER